MNRYIWAPLAALVIACSAHAQSAAETGTPDAVVKNAIETTMSAIHADPGSRAGDLDKIAAIVQQKFVPEADFRRTARLAAGSAWDQATPAQQDELFKQFQVLMVRTYAAELNQIRDQSVQFKFLPSPPPPASATDAVVKTQVVNAGDVMNIEYRVTKTAGGWKVYDINMMGAWLIQVYRQQFSDQIAKGGIDGLIKFLAAHNEPVSH
ncbi:phospholipid-binding protein MlaC [Burkholderia sp. L27(2015)]|uniref:MlaC/ttg2D family ABC transporter substrate-binding protein n=1 Tax=Burkholderia sp. L27(2015) TaxID=1641858 RepID=UPI00131CA11A|nr:ABC transporter substrate-binding protein [Burkholderia sp. L27(2015)]